MAIEHPRKVLIGLGLISIRDRCYDTARDNLFERLDYCEKKFGRKNQDYYVCVSKAFADYEATTEKCMGIKIPFDPSGDE